MGKYVAGIDFGTTNSAAAISDGGTPRMVDVERGHDTIPTALYFPEKSPKIYFGREAQRMYTDGDTSGRFMRSIKRILGTSLMNGATIINGHPVKFDTVILNFMKYLKSKIDMAAGEDVESVVVGRPVHFCNNDPEGDRKAQEELERITKSAGFKNVSFQYEPIAAAFAHEQAIKTDKLACVVDIGGGTSDFTIIRLSPNRKNNLDRTADVLANTGVRIGGNDFDKSFSLRVFMPYFGMGTEYKAYNKTVALPTGPFISLSTWSAVNDVYNYKTLNMVRGYVVWGLEPEKVKRLYEIINNHLGHKNLDYVESTKIQLSKKNETDVVLDFLSDNPTINTNRAGFEKAIAQNIKDIEKAVQECIEKAGVKNTDIDLVVLTGGSTEIPYVSRVMQSYFPNAELSSENKLASVGLGLAYDAIRRYSGYNSFIRQKNLAQHR